MKLGDEEIHASLQLPTSYFLGADLTYTFMALNSLMHWGDQKYKLEEQIRADYPKIQQEFMSGDFPPDILEKFRGFIRIRWVTNRSLFVLQAC